MKKDVSPTGVWSQELADATHQSSDNLALFLADYLPKDKPVYDFGCGNGFYLGFLEQNGFKCTGVEGNKLNNFKCSTVVVHDLTKPVNIGEKGSVISLEIGEHLPKYAQETFTQTLLKHCDKHLILSWAEIGQPGIGHINCRSQEDVIYDLNMRGFYLKEDITAQVRSNIEENTSWFRRTLLIFERA